MIPYLSPGAGKAFWVLGEMLTVKVGGEETGGAWAAMEVTAQVRNGPPPHIHTREDESFYVVEGQFWFLYGEKTVDAGPGSFVHVPRGTLHTYNNVGTKPGKLFVIVSPAGLEKFFEELGQPVTDPTTPPPFKMDTDKLTALARKYGLEIRMPTG